MWSCLMLMCGLAVAAGASDDSSTTDSHNKTLKGVWEIVAAFDQGEFRTAAIGEREMASDNTWNIGLIFSGPKSKTTYRCRYKLGTDENPKTIDCEITELRNGVPAEEPTHIFGIYELKRDTLILCLPDIGQERPKKFAIKRGCSLMVYRRVKARTEEEKWIREETEKGKESRK